MSQLPLITNDKELLELAEQPTQKIFPVMDQASSMRLLLFALILFPCWYGFIQQTFSLKDAIWSLDELSAYLPHSDSLKESEQGTATSSKSEATSSSESDNLHARPNLLPRLQGFLSRQLHNLGLTWLDAFQLPSAMMVAGLMLSLWFLFFNMGGDKLAIWIVILGCIHGPFLRLCQTPRPVACLVLILIPVVGCILLQLRATLIQKLFLSVAAGIFLGGTFLLDTGHCWLLISTLLVYEVRIHANVKPHTRDRRNDPAEQLKTATHQPDSDSKMTSTMELLGIVAGLLTLFGAWYYAPERWELPQWSFTGIQLPDDSSSSAELFQFQMLQDWLKDCLAQANGLTGLILLGCFSTTYPQMFTPEKPKNSQAVFFHVELKQLLQLWLFFNLTIPILLLIVFGRDWLEWLPYWKGSLWVPYLGLASIGLMVITERTIKVSWITKAILISFLVMISLYPPFRSSWIPIFVLVLTSGILFVYLHHWFTHSPQRDYRAPRLFLSIAVLSLLAANLVTGLHWIHQKTVRDHQLKQISRVFRNLPEDSNVLILRYMPSFQLAFLTRVEFPRHRLHNVDDWDAVFNEHLLLSPVEKSDQTESERPCVIVAWENSRPPLHRLPSGYELRNLKTIPDYYGQPLEIYFHHKVKSDVKIDWGIEDWASPQH